MGTKNITRTSPLALAMAVSIRDDAEDDMEEGEEQKPYIVDLVPAGAKQCA